MAKYAQMVQPQPAASNIKIELSFFCRESAQKRIRKPELNKNEEEIK